MKKTFFLLNLIWLCSLCSLVFADSPAFKNASAVTNSDLIDIVTRTIWEDIQSVDEDANVKEQKNIFCAYFNGMRAAEKRKDAEFYAYTSKMNTGAGFHDLKNRVLTRRNLEERDLFFKNLDDRRDFTCMQPLKLYYTILKNGTGDELIPDNNSIILHYTILKPNRSVITDTRTAGIPQKVNLVDTIEGFSKGLTGMRMGEIRELYIHPSLAYGADSDQSFGNYLIANVELLGISDAGKNANTLLFTGSIQQEPISNHENELEKEYEKLQQDWAFYNGFKIWAFYKDNGSLFHLSDIEKSIDDQLKKDNESLCYSDLIVDIKDRLDFYIYSRKEKEQRQLAEAFFKNLDLSANADIKCIVPNRLYYQSLKEGSGEKVKSNEILSIHYYLKTSFGNILFNSRENGIAVQMDLARAMRGFSEGIPGMKIGEMGIFYIHPLWMTNDLLFPPYFVPFTIAEVEILKAI